MITIVVACAAVNLCCDSGALNSLGVTGSEAACVGGDMPSITGDYAGGGGYRPNARGTGAWAFGYSSFANGDGCFSGGRQNVAGRIPDDPLGEVKFATAFGYANYAWGQGSFAAGLNNRATGYGATALGWNNHATGVGSFALGNQCQADGYGSFAGGLASTASGTGDSAFGSSTAAGGYGFAAGYQCAATDGAAVALGNQSRASAQSALAAGYQCAATARGASARGIQAVATRSGQDAWSGGAFVSPGDAQWSRYQVRGTAANGATVELEPLEMAAGAVYAGRVSVVVSLVGAVGIAYRVIGFLAHCTASGAVIDAQETERSWAVGGTRGITLYSRAAKLVVAVTAAQNETVRAVATFEFVEVGSP